MKLKITFLLTLLTLCSFAQKVNTINSVAKMAVFPGCDSIAKTKEDITKCFSNSLNAYSTSALRGFSEFADYFQIDSARLSVSFVIDATGKLTNFKYQTNSKFLEEFTNSSLTILDERLTDLGMPIKPAEDENGNKVAMNFRLPVNFVSGINNPMSSNEMVLFTTQDQNGIVYEAREDRAQKIKVYKKSGDNFTLQNTYSEYYKWMADEPFRTAVENSISNGQGMLVTSGVINGEKYKVLINNFFSLNSEIPITINVFKVNENDEMLDVYVYNSKIEFNQSPYGGLIRR